MQRQILLAWILSLWCHPAAADHRIVVVSATDQRSSEPSEIRVVELDSGKTLAETQVGATAEMALSLSGERLAVLSHYSVAGIAQPRPRLEIFRVADLSVVQRGYLPVPRSTHKHTPTSAWMLFANDNEVVVQRMDGHDAVLSRVRLETDEAGVFQQVGESVRLPGAVAISFLRTDWPRVTGFGLDGNIFTLDLEKGTEISKTVVESRSQGIWGRVVTSDSRFGYYVPQSSGSRPAGQLQRIDLSADPPKAILIAEQLQHGLRARVSAVSEIAGALLIADQKWENGGQVPSPRIKFFHTLNLAAVREIGVSLQDCDSISISADGKYAYVLDFFHGGLSVVEISSGREVKVLNDVGTHPAFAIALP